MGRVGQRALSVKQVEAEKRIGYHADGLAVGLYLQVLLWRQPGTTEGRAGGNAAEVQED